MVSSPTATAFIVSIVNPLEVPYLLERPFPEEVFTTVDIRILYIVVVDKYEEGVTVKVLFEFDATGEELIWTQVVKLSEEI